MFTPKTFAEILTTMVNYLVSQSTAVTDYNSGSVLRAFLEAVAMEVERTYMQTLEGISDAVDTSLYTAFGFGLLDASGATGIVRLTRTGGYAPDITVSAGSRFGVPNTTKTYRLLNTVVWTGGAASTTFDISVTAESTGEGGNTPSASITQIILPITGVASCSNPLAFINGTDAETTDQRRQRFATYIAAIPRGTVSALEFGAKTAQLLDGNGYVTERVAKAHAYDTGTGTASLYMHNGVGAPGGLTTTAALLAAMQTIINGTTTTPGWRAAGIVVTMGIAAEVDQQIKVVITSLFDGFSMDMVVGAAQQAIKDLVAGLNIADTLRLAAITAAVRNVAGVRDCVVVLPATNITATDTQIIVSSSVTASRFIIQGGLDAVLL